MTKPFGIMELISRVKAMLRRANLQTDSDLEFDGIVLNDAHHIRHSLMQTLLSPQYFYHQNVYAREKYIDFLSHRITEYMVNANRYGLPLEDRKRLGGLFHVVIDKSVKIKPDSIEHLPSDILATCPS